MTRGEYVRRLREHLDSAVAGVQYRYSRRHKYGWDRLAMVGKVPHYELREYATESVRDELPLIRALRHEIARVEGGGDPHGQEPER